MKVFARRVHPRGNHPDHYYDFNIFSEPLTDALHEIMFKVVRVSAYQVNPLVYREFSKHS